MSSTIIVCIAAPAFILIMVAIYTILVVIPQAKQWKRYMETMEALSKHFEDDPGDNQY